MARRAFSSTSSSDAAGAAGADVAAPLDGAASAGAASVAAVAGSEEPFDMKYQAQPASATTATATPISIAGDLPDFSSPLLPLDGAVTALSASAVAEMRAASLTARRIAAGSTGESTSA